MRCMGALSQPQLFKVFQAESRANGKGKKTATQNGEKYCETESLLTLWMSPPPPLRRNRASCMQGQLERAITDNHILRRSMTPLSLAQFMQKMFFFFFLRKGKHRDPSAGQTTSSRIE